MKCNRFEKLLIPYYEGELSERLSKEVAEHVEACACCAAELRELTGMVDVLRSTEYPAAEPSTNLRSLVMSRIARDPVPKVSWWNRIQSYSTIAAVVLLFGIAVGTYINVEGRIGLPKAREKAGTAVFTPEEKERLRSLGYLGDDGTGVSTGKPHAVPEATDRVAALPPAAKGTPGMPGMMPGMGGKMAAKAGPSDPLPNAVTLSPDRVTKPHGTREERPVLSRPAPAPGAGFDSLKDTGMKGAPGMGRRAPDFRAPERPGMAQAPLGGGQQVLKQSAGKDGFASGETSAAPAEARPAPPAASEVAPMERHTSAAGNSMVLDDDSASVRRKESGDRVLRLEAKLREFPNSRAVLLQLLQAYRDAGRVDDEYAIARRLTELDKANPEYWFAYAQAAEKAKHSGTAMDAYKRAIDLDLTGPDLDLAKSRLGVLEKADR